MGKLGGPRLGRREGRRASGSTSRGARGRFSLPTQPVPYPRAEPRREIENPSARRTGRAARSPSSKRGGRGRPRSATNVGWLGLLPSIPQQQHELARASRGLGRTRSPASRRRHPWPRSEDRRPLSSATRDRSPRTAGSRARSAPRKSTPRQLQVGREDLSETFLQEDEEVRASPKAAAMRLSAPATGGEVAPNGARASASCFVGCEAALPVLGERPSDRGVEPRRHVRDAAQLGAEAPRT